MRKIHEKSKGRIRLAPFAAPLLKVFFLVLPFGLTTAESKTSWTIHKTRSQAYLKAKVIRKKKSRTTRTSAKAAAKGLFKKLNPEDSIDEWDLLEHPKINVLKINFNMEDLDDPEFIVARIDCDPSAGYSALDISSGFIPRAVAGFSQRQEKARGILLVQGGGDEKTEQSVARALAWLAAHQERDGRWDSVKYGGKDADVSITGLALLAFLGAGHSEDNGKYYLQVRRAVRWLKEIQNMDGKFHIEKSTHGVGYHHAIAGMAMAEAAAMSGRRATLWSARRALSYSTDIHQGHKNGKKIGWRYQANSAKSDLSVSGWFMEQLIIAQRAGLQINPDALEGAHRFLDSVEAPVDQPIVSERHRYGYSSIDNIGIRRTAVGCLSRMGFGTKKEELRKALAWMVRNGGTPTFGTKGGSVDLYYWYYATQCVFQVGGPLWQRWNRQMKRALLPHQRRGHDEDGSWDPVGAYAQYWGRVGQTALATLCLEVYYRYPRSHFGVLNLQRPLMKMDRARINILIDNLDDDDYAIRESATLELIKMGSRAYHPLQERLKTTTTLETKLRLRRVLQKIEY